jgi:hypothetical protein
MASVTAPATSPSAAQKAARELNIFREFIKMSGLPIDPATVENREPPEPDILCIIQGDGPVAFELVELCNPELAKDIGDQLKRGTQSKFLMLDDPSRVAFLSKLGKSYRTNAPFELVCYTGRTAVPSDLSLITLRDLADDHGIAPFRRVWFLGEETCEIVSG